MMFSPPESGSGANLSDSLFIASLPQRRCTPCGRLVARRRPRVQLRASWRDQDDTICTECWQTICEWAGRFALQQQSLPLG